MAALIRAENRPVPEKLARVIGNLIVWLEGEEQTELRRGQVDRKRKVTPLLFAGYPINGQRNH